MRFLLCILAVSILSSSGKTQSPILLKKEDKKSSNCNCGTGCDCRLSGQCDCLIAKSKGECKCRGCDCPKIHKGSLPLTIQKEGQLLTIEAIEIKISCLGSRYQDLQSLRVQTEAILNEIRGLRAEIQSLRLLVESMRNQPLPQPSPVPPTGPIIVYPQTPQSPSLPRYELVPSPPKYEIPPGSTPRYEVPPGSTPRYEIPPGSTPRYEVPPGSTPRYEVPPGSTPKYMPPASSDNISNNGTDGYMRFSLYRSQNTQLIKRK